MKSAVKQAAPPVKRLPRTDIYRNGKRVMFLYMAAHAARRGDPAGWYWTTGEGMSRVFDTLEDAERDAEGNQCGYIAVQHGR